MGSSVDVTPDEADTALWLYLTLCGVGVQWAFIAFSEIVPESYELVAVLLLFVIPIGAYLDTKRFYGAQSATVRRGLWILSLTVPVFNLAFAVAYWFRRRERVDGIRANWSGVVTVALLVSLVTFVGFGVVQEGTVGIDIVGFSFVTSWILMPVGVYHDIRYVSKTADWPSNAWVWIAGAAIIFLNLVICPTYLYKRRTKAGALEAAEDIEAVRESAEETFAEAERVADDGEYERAMELATEAADSLRNAETTTESGLARTLGIRELRRRIERTTARWAATVARRQIERGEEVAADGDYERAIDLATAAVQRLDRFEGTDVQGVIDQRERAQRSRLDWVQAVIEERLADAEQAARDGDHERALETCDRLLERIDSVEDEWADVGSRLDSVRHAVEKQRCDASEAKARSLLESGADAADRDDYEEAIQRATETVEHLRTASDRATDAGVDTGSLEQLRDETIARKFDWIESRIRERLAESESVAQRGDYEEAIDHVTAAIDTLQSAVDQGADTDSMKTLLERATEQRAEWRRDVLVERINEAMDADPGDYDAASAELLAVLSEISEIDALPADEQVLLEGEAREAYLTVRTRGARSLLESGQQRLDSGEYERARDRFDRVVDVVSETVETVADWSDVDTAELADLRAEAETQLADSHVTLIEDVLDMGIEQFERGEYEQAEETFTTASDRAVRATESITDEAGQQRLERLRARAEDNAEAAQRASLGIGDEPTLRRPDSAGGRDASRAGGTPAGAAGRHPPTSIPRATELSVSYEALERGDPIGKGGNADVYRGSVTVDGTTHTLALKEPRFTGTIGTTVVDEFVREAETWAKLDDHDHIVGVVDWGTSPLPWIAMEYMDGGDLSARLDDIAFEEGAWVAVKVTEAVLHAHRRGIAHLDLKPENILFRGTDPQSWDVPKVADWGLARLLLDHSKSIEGVTPRYAAPEQFEDGSDVGQGTDIYQLGAVWYELFTGQPPFSGSPMAVVQKIATEPVTPPTEVDPSLPNAVDDALLPALEKDPADRYEDLLYFRDALEDAADSL